MAYILTGVIAAAAAVWDMCTAVRVDISRRDWDGVRGSSLHIPQTYAFLPPIRPKRSKEALGPLPASSSSIIASTNYAAAITYSCIL